jgi:hypothetical protein
MSTIDIHLKDYLDKTGMSKKLDACSPAPEEGDPNGLDQHTSGAKMDLGKQWPGLVLRGFARAIKEVVKVGTFGANKYIRNGWMDVPDGEFRYEQALYRHLLADLEGEKLDPESGISHLVHAAWNILVIIELRKNAD